MRRRCLAVLCLAAVTAACGGGEKTVAPASEAAYDAPVAPPSNASVTPGGGTELGVKECDDYLAKYTECVSSKVPGQVRAAMVAAIDQSKAQWKAAASTPEGRAGLVQACTQAREASRASMQAYGCRW